MQATREMGLDPRWEALPPPVELIADVIGVAVFSGQGFLWGVSEWLNGSPDRATPRMVHAGHPGDGAGRAALGMPMLERLSWPYLNLHGACRPPWRWGWALEWVSWPNQTLHGACRPPGRWAGRAVGGAAAARGAGR